MHETNYMIKSAKEMVKATDAELMEKLHQYGPLSVDIMANTPVFLHYKDGIIREQPASVKTDHVVVLVGWGQETVKDEHGNEETVPYWIIRNSMGTTWGKQGYGKIERDKNMLGIATLAFYVELH